MQHLSSCLALKIVQSIVILVLLNSCVAYLPPSSMHMDMRPTEHPVFEGETKHTLAASATTMSTIHSNRGLPEVEKTFAKSVDMQYGIAKEDHSAAIAAGYSFGLMELPGASDADHSNFILRSSASYDKTFGHTRFNLIKFQLAGSRGYGEYQDTLATVEQFRDEYNYVFLMDDMLWSVGLGAHAYRSFSEDHMFDMGFYLNHSTDFRKEGFREDFYNIQFGYTYNDVIQLKVGGMLDARLLPRSRTGYVSLGYRYTFSKRKSEEER